ncbi:MAG: EF-hand domain-containing protein [Armatimonadota bacterium]
MELRRLLIATSVVTLLLAGVCAAQAAPAEGQNADFFDRLDANQDGKIDADEFKGPDEAFARMDRNGDGFITRDELGGEGDRPGFGRPGNYGQRGDVDPTERWQKMLERFDANEDGKISAEEFQGAEKVLRFLDANNDGEVTEDEAMQAGNRRGERAPIDPAERWNRLIDNCDANEDGMISQEEWPGRAEKFEELDRDGDGQLVQDEMPKPRQGAERGDRAGGAIGPEFLKRHDADGDGKISREEWPLAPEMFDQYDPDGDAFITEGDLEHLGNRRPARQDPAQLFIGLMDKNGDGQVSDEEWSNFFEATDVNADGMISHAEMIGRLQEALRPPADPGPAEEPPAPDGGF